MRDSKGLKTREGMEYIASCPKDENITGIVVHKDTLFVSTDKHLYRLTDDKRLEIED